MSYVFSILGGTEQKVSGIYPNVSWYFLGCQKMGCLPPKKNMVKKNKFQGVYYISPQKDREVVQSES
jgi:hypothetical protein